MFLNILEVDDLIGIYAQITIIAGFLLGTIYIILTKRKSFISPIIRSTLLTILLFVLGFILYMLFDADEFGWLVIIFTITYHIPTLLLYALVYFILIRSISRLFKRTE